MADAPWFVLEPGNIIHGQLLGIYDREDKRAKSGRSKFFQVQLITACKVRSGRGEDAVQALARVGAIVNLNYTPLTAPLKEFCAKIMRGGEYEVYATVGDKKELANGNTMWLIDTHVRVVKDPTAPEAEQPDFEGGAAEAAGE